MSDVTFVEMLNITNLVIYTEFGVCNLVLFSSSVRIYLKM